MRISDWSSDVCSSALHSSEIVDNFFQAVRDAPEVLECYAVTGDADFLLKVLVESSEGYDEFLHRFLFNLPGVRQTRTIVALREIKHEVELPLPLEAAFGRRRAVTFGRTSCRERG